MLLEKRLVRPLAELPVMLTALPFAFRTAGDPVEGGLPFGWSVADFQKWTLIYLGVSSLAFVVVWLVGYLRRG
jgi:hypothetical protein